MPRIGNDWGQCDPQNPLNRRTRSSIVVEHNGFRLLVDTGPDLRQQLLDNDIDAIDAVIWTHDHADHCHGIDDLRQLYFKNLQPVMGFASDVTATALLSRFGYVFTGNSGYPATASLEILRSPTRIGPFTVQSAEQPHGPVSSTGLRIESGGHAIGYAIDFSVITDTMTHLYREVDCLIVDCLRHEPHPTHAHYGMALQLYAETNAKSAVLTHMDKSMDYAATMAIAPPDVCAGHDRLVIEL